MKSVKLTLVSVLLLALLTPVIAKNNYTVEDFFRNARYSNMQLSPNGKYLAAIAPQTNRRNIAIIDLEDRSKSSFITNLNDQDVAGYSWITNDRIIFAVDADGQEALAMYAVDRTGGKIKTLIDPLGKDAGKGVGLPSPGVLDPLEDEPKYVLISYDARKVGSPDIFKMNIKTGSRKMVERNPGDVQGYMTDHDGKIRMALAQDKLFSEVRYRETEESEWRVLTRYRWDDPNGFAPMAFDYDNQTLFVSSGKDHDTSAIYRYSPSTGEFGEQIFHNPNVDAGGLMFSDKRKKLLGATYYTDKPQWEGMDEQFTRMLKSLEASFPNRTVNISSLTKEEDLAIVTVGSDVAPTEYYKFDVENKKMEFLAASMDWIDPTDMAERRPISYTSRDGLTIHGYLTIPNGSEGKNMPLIINPHGGPWARDTWGFNVEHQFFANRGYAVLQMNFRGSTGYGRKHLESAYKQWGKTMQDDISDAVQWAVDEGIANKERVCIYGGSYGGYATMAGMTSTPDLYKCGINYVGVTDIALLFETMPKRWNLGAEQMKQQVGDPKTESEMLAEASPLNHVENIKAPIFIVHGRKDPRVNIKHATLLRKQMDKHNKAYEWMVKNNEGHGFRKEENRIELYTAMGKFFDKYIGEDGSSGP